MRVGWVQICEWLYVVQIQSEDSYAHSVGHIGSPIMMLIVELRMVTMFWAYVQPVLNTCCFGIRLGVTIYHIPHLNKCQNKKGNW